MIEHLRELEKKATKGPWRYAPWHIAEGPPHVKAPDGYTILFETAGDNNAEMIAALRNAAPLLIAVVEAVKINGHGCNGRTWCPVCAALRALEGEKL